MEAKQKVEAAIHLLIKNEPFFAEMLFRMKFMYTTKKVPSMGVTIQNSKVLLYINEDFVKDKLSVKNTADILKHECMHILCDHINRGKQYGKANHVRYNAAADLAINHLISDTVNEIGGLSVERINKELEINLEKNQLAEYYYSNLPSNEEGQSMLGEGEMDDHSMWEESEGDAVAKEIVRELVKDAAKTAKRSAGGNIPGDVQELIDDLIKPSVNWKNQLRLFVCNAVNFNKIATRKKRNRRYGIMFAGKKKEKKARIAVCVDTSGSISDQQLVQFFSEIDAIAKILDEVIIIEADCEVQNVYVYEPGKKYSPKGRGGTAYNSGLKKAVELGVDGVAYFGDFDTADTPENPGIPTLWVGVGNQPAPASFGKVIYLEE